MVSATEPEKYECVTMCSFLTLFRGFNKMISFRHSYGITIDAEWQLRIQAFKPVLDMIAEMNKPMVIDNLQKQKYHQFLCKPNQRNCLKF